MQKERGFVNFVGSSRHIYNNVDFMFAGGNKNGKIKWENFNSTLKNVELKL